MKTKKTNRSEVRENYLMVKITDEEKRKIQESANDVGLTMSSFVRMVLKDFMKNANN